MKAFRKALGKNAGKMILGVAAIGITAIGATAFKRKVGTSGD